MLLTTFLLVSQLFLSVLLQVHHGFSSSSAAHAVGGQHTAAQGSFCSSSRPPRPSRVLVRAYAQADKRVARITVAGPPSQPPRVIEVDDPKVSQQNQLLQLQAHRHSCI